MAAATGAEQPGQFKVDVVIDYGLSHLGGNEVNCFVSISHEAPPGLSISKVEVSRMIEEAFSSRS